MLLGVEQESSEGITNCEEILAVPGLGFAGWDQAIWDWPRAICRSRATLIRGK